MCPVDGASNALSAIDITLTIGNPWMVDRLDMVPIDVQFDLCTKYLATFAYSSYGGRIDKSIALIDLSLANDNIAHRTNA